MEIPTKHFFACGAAEGDTAILSEGAARSAAGLGRVNLVATGPIIPPGSTLTTAIELPAGSLVPVISASFTSTLPGEVISAGIATAEPVDPGQPGIAISYANCGHKEDIEAIVRRLVEEEMASRGLGVRDLRSVAVQHRVQETGTVFVAVVLR